MTFSPGYALKTKMYRFVKAQILFKNNTYCYMDRGVTLISILFISNDTKLISRFLNQLIPPFQFCFGCWSNTKLTKLPQPRMGFTHNERFVGCCFFTQQSTGGCWKRTTNYYDKSELSGEKKEMPTRNTGYHFYERKERERSW